MNTQMLMNRRKQLAAAARRNARGFTLLEMMLVVAIIGILASVAVINLVGGADKARIAATKASMRTIVTGVKSYKADKGVYPANLQTLVTDKHLEKVYKDAWKQDFIYASPGAAGKDFSLISFGPDQQQGTEDDIDWWVVDAEN